MPLYIKYIRKIKYIILSTGLQAWTLSGLVSQFKFGDSELDIEYSKKVRNNPKYIDVTNCHNTICLFISNIYAR